MAIVNPKFKLTNSKVRALPVPTEHQALYWCSETKGFGIRITAADSRSWIVQGRVNGKTRRSTIGKIQLLTAEDARRRAQAQLLDMYDGKDPKAEKQAQRAKSETLRDVMEDYVANKRTKHGPLRAGSKEDYRHCVEVIFVEWADKPVASIRRDACIKKFREMSETAPVRTNQSFRYLRALLNWAREKSATEEGVYTILPINPVAQMLKNGGLIKWNPEKPRTSRVPKNKIGKVWQALENYCQPEANLPSTCTSSDLIMFMLLTGARKGESSQLTWDRVHLDAEVPYFHFDITKNHNPLTLPISDALKTVFERRMAARTNSDYVFPAPSGKTGYLRGTNSVFKKISKVAEQHLHPHCLRRTFDDIAQTVGIDGDQRRQLLNHLPSDVHGQSYANNPDPAALNEASQKISLWILEQAENAGPIITG